MRRSGKHSGSAVASLVVLAILLAACGSSSKGPGSTTGSGKSGGKLVFAAEQWPKCINPITQCAQSSWLQWTVPIHVLPRLMELDTHSNFVPSPLLTGAPTLTSSGPNSPFTVTYHLNPKATWQPDGTPITSKDVSFTLQAYLKSTGSLSTTGYDEVKSVDDSSPTTVKVIFKKPYADWADVFGGFSGVVLEAAKFTSPNAGNTMQTSVGFSGGPWILKSWSPSQEILLPNKKYWDASRIPLVDQVTFIPKPDTNTEVQAIKSGEASVGYPQPSADNVPQLKGGNIETKFGVTTQYEALWLNEKPGHPFEDKNLRAAFSYAFDRQKFLNDIVKPFSPDVQMLNCAAWVPAFGKWCDNTQFADITFSPAKVKENMQKSGYALDSKGIWAKNGKELTIKWMENTDNSRRIDTQTEFIPLLKKQGFNLVTDNVDAGTFFEQAVPTGAYDLAMFINITGTDPTVTSNMACDSIPGPANQGKGQNDYWYCNQQSTALMHQSDAELDLTKRLDMIHRIGKYARDDNFNLPLYSFPAMVSWNTGKVSGPIDTYVNSPESAFWNMYDWSAK
ncbi:MAG: peptide/nickel transport system substrate-binding protein [Actinomycetota bacterium]|nr:peptide/nickel transport system substrate-binding protein [Actinomycetota bacterium]